MIVSVKGLDVDDDIAHGGPFFLDLGADLLCQFMRSIYSEIGGDCDVDADIFWDGDRGRKFGHVESLRRLDAACIRIAFRDFAPIDIIEKSADVFASI